MKHISFVVIMGAVAAAAAAAISPAQAYFYKLDGRFECLEGPNPVCGDATTSPAPKPQTSVPMIVAPMAPSSPATIAVQSSPNPPPGDPFAAMASRIRTGHPSTSDIATLIEDAKSGNPRAIELLAWCELSGLGLKRDPVEAYILYGVANAAAVPHAGDNQAVIYEMDLTSEQRQQVLDLENQGVSIARISSR
jgi:TPR repeat protein